MPKLRHVVEVTNPKTKVKSEVAVGNPKFFRLILSHDTWQVIIIIFH